MTLATYRNLCTEVYELTKPVGGEYPDVPYFIQHLSKIGGRILQGMVGTGRLLIPQSYHEKGKPVLTLLRSYE